jgi:hypothetical protein
LIPGVPERGSVIRYAYLWADEKRRGREEGRKDRPAVILALSIRDVEGTINVLVLAVTHTPPSDPDDAMPFPHDAKRRIGLDTAPAWIVTTEANAFVWPGPDVRPVPGRAPRTVLYGKIPDDLLQQVARSYLLNRQKQRSRLVSRTE